MRATHAPILYDFVIMSPLPLAAYNGNTALTPVCFSKGTMYDLWVFLYDYMILKKKFSKRMSGLSPRCLLRYSVELYACNLSNYDDRVFNLSQLHVLHCYSWPIDGRHPYQNSNSNIYMHCLKLLTIYIFFFTNYL